MLQIVAQIASVFQIGHYHAVGKHGRGGVVLYLGVAFVIVAFNSVRNLIEIGYTAEAVFCVIGQTYVEKARIFLSYEGVHVSLAWPDKQEVIGGY